MYPGLTCRRKCPGTNPRMKWHISRRINPAGISAPKITPFPKWNGSDSGMPAKGRTGNKTPCKPKADGRDLKLTTKR